MLPTLTLGDHPHGYNVTLRQAKNFTPAAPKLKLSLHEWGRKMVQACVAPPLHHAMQCWETQGIKDSSGNKSRYLAIIWPRISCQMFILEASFCALGQPESGNLQVALMSALDVWPGNRGRWRVLAACDVEKVTQMMLENVSIIPAHCSPTVYMWDMCWWWFGKHVWQFSNLLCADFNGLQCLSCESLTSDSTGT